MILNDKMQFSVFLIISLSYFHAVTSTCTFPTTLQGEWDTPSKGNLTINSTHIVGYDVYTYTSLTFECHLNEGTQYVIRSDDFMVLGLGNSVNAVTCMKFTVQSTNKYVYFLQTAELVDANNERVQFIAATKSDVTVAGVCDDTSVVNTIQESKIFIKKDNAASAATLCSTNLLGEFYYENVTACTTGSHWDACNPNTEMTFNYTQCSEIQAFSQNGSVYCVHTATSGSLSITYVYNRDDTTDESTYYRFSCMASESTNGYVVVTTNPQDCYKNQTSTYVPTGGKTITLSANVTCVPSEDSTAVNSAMIAAVVVVVILLVIVGLGVGYYVYMKKFKKVGNTEKVIDKEKSTLSNSSRGKDAVTPSVVHADVTSPRNGGSHGNDPRLREPNPMTLQDNIHH